MVCLFGLTTKFFMLDRTKDVIATIRGSDMALFLILLLLPVVYIRNKSIFSVRDDKLSRWTYIFIAFYLLELLITTILGNETWFNSLKVVRVSFFMWGFFILRAIPIASYKKFLKIALWITLAQGVLYFLQFEGVMLLADGNEESVVFGSPEFSAMNIPTLTVLFLFLQWNMNFLGKKKFILFAILLVLALSTFVRGTIIAILLGLAYYFIFISKRNRRVVIAFLLLLVIPLALRVISEKSVTSGHNRALEDVEYVYGQRHNIKEIDKSRGTFSFRIAMVAERVVWLSTHPQYFLMGVGTMHEDSPRTLSMFDFSTGTTNEDRAYGYTVIESGDITWVPIILRYGLIGIVIHVIMFVVLFLSTWKRNDLLVMLSPLVIYMFLRTFDGPFFESPVEVFLLALYYAMVSSANLRQEKMLM